MKMLKNQLIILRQILVYLVLYRDKSKYIQLKILIKNDVFAKKGNVKYACFLYRYILLTKSKENCSQAR